MTTPVVRELLGRSAAERRRVVDDHMFTVADSNGRRVGSFRLQLFAAPGTPPVAIATQTTEEGVSLINKAERYAAEVWRRHAPDSAEAPIWIERQLFPGRPEEFTLVSFSSPGRYELVSPRWSAISDGEVARLVGSRVDGDRGRGYQPWPREPEAYPVYQVASTILLPRPRGVERGCIRRDPPWWRCLLRQVLPRRRPRDCCYYHGVDWHQVCAAAIQITRQVQDEGLEGEAFADRVDDLASAASLPTDARDALIMLLCAGGGVMIERGDDGRWYYVNGRHRTTAMLDAGVRRTVIIQWVMPTDQPSV